MKQKPLNTMTTNLKYRYVTDPAQYDRIIPIAAESPPSNVTVLYEYFMERMLESGPEMRNQKENIVFCIPFFRKKYLNKWFFFWIFLLKKNDTIVDKRRAHIKVLGLVQSINVSRS